MVFKFFKRRWQRIVVIILSVIIAVILILGFLVNLYMSPILASKVKEVVSKSSDGLYMVDFSSADLHVLQGTIVIYNIVLKPDSAVYNREKKEHLAPNNLIELHIKRLTLDRIHPLRLYFKHKIEIDEIVVNNPELRISYALNHTKDTVLKDNRTPWQKISKSLRSIHVGNIKLGDVKFKYEDYSGNKVAISELKEMNLSAFDLLLDSTTQFDKSRLLFCRDIVAQLNNYSANTSDGLYSYKINSLKLSTKKSQLTIQGLTLKPIKPDLFFDKTWSDRFTLHLDSLQLNNFDFLTYHKYRVVNASSFIIGGGTLQLYGSPNKNPNDNADRVRSFPNEALKKVNADMKVDTILVHRLHIYYTEFNKKSQKAGSISFNNTSGRILNVTTNTTALQKNNICTADFTSYFMNYGKLKVAFTFNLTDENKSFSYKGSLGQIDLKQINSAVVPLAMIKINSGMVKQLDFDIKADRYKANGKVNVLYNDLKVTILKADTVMNKLKHRPIESLFANIFILKHDNPDDASKAPRTYSVNYTRKITDPFFKSIWHTLLEGIKPAVGLDKKTQDATVAMIQQRKTDKLDRQAKKELRIERRSERKKKREEKKLLKNKATPGFIIK
jgi:hypothetical protein